MQKPTPSKGSEELCIKPAVVTVGDELIFGERVNENQQWLLHFCWERGHPASIAMSLSDDVSIIAFWLRQLLGAAHYPILISGGIGGTHDDRTREGIAKACGVPLIKHEACWQILTAKYAARFNEQRQRMAWLPEGCELIANPFGSPGFHLRGIFAFPGFPRMLQSMVLETMGDILTNKAPSQWVVREHVLPVFEGDIAGEVESFAEKYPRARVGIYPESQPGRKEVTVRLRCFMHQKEILESFDELIKTIQTGSNPVS